MSTKSSEAKQFWFPAKRYGWGWGLPTEWRGWAVLIVFAVLLAVGALVFLPRFGPAVFVVYSALLTSLLVVVCLVKGEPPKWRWGAK